jgi:hypothetical protein
MADFQLTNTSTSLFKMLFSSCGYEQADVRFCPEATAYYEPDVDKLHCGYVNNPIISFTISLKMTC